MQALLAGLALFFGEFFIIGAELWAAKHFQSAAHPARIFLAALGAAIAFVLAITGIIVSIVFR